MNDQILVRIHCADDRDSVSYVGVQAPRVEVGDTYHRNDRVWRIERIVDTPSTDHQGRTIDLYCVETT